MSIITDRIKSMFKSEKIDTLEKAESIIKEMLNNFGAKEEDARIETDNESMIGWAISVNNIIIYIYLFKGDDDFLYVRIVSPVLMLPSENILPFYRTLLEQNLYLHDIGFAVEENMILIVAQRRIDLTNLEECKFIIAYMAEIGEKTTKSLSEEFKAKIFELDDNQ